MRIRPYGCRPSEVTVGVVAFSLCVSTWLLVTATDASPTRGAMTLGGFFWSGVLATCFVTQHKWRWFAVGCFVYWVASRLLATFLILGLL
jgi:hypothetical protein